MVLHVCRDCDREFTKTEHFKRHRRSHTQEKPYECPTCHKSFSRSDVLFRHTKLHTEAGENGPDALASESSIRIDSSQLTSESPIHPVESSIPAKRRAEVNTQALQAAQHQYDQIDPSLRAMQLPGMNGSFNNYRSPSTNLHHSTPQGALPVHTPSQSSTYAPPMLTPMHSQNGMDSHRSQQALQPPPPPRATSISMATGTPHTSHHSNGPLDPSLDMSSFDGNGNDMLQYWLRQADNDIDFDDLQMPAFRGPLHHHNNPPTPAPRHSPPAVPQSVSQSDSGSYGSIPESRFSRVQDVWKSKAAKSHCFQNLWLELAQSPYANIFCCDDPPLNKTSNDGYPESRVSNGSAGKSRLAQEFGTPNITPNGPDGTANKQSSHSFNFPPPEVLDISLGIYFRRMAPLSPFIHIPTFQESTTPPTLLFVMCVLGFSAMNTSGGSKFLKKAFYDIRHRAISELVATASSPTTLEERMIAYATGFLALQLATVSFDADIIAQSQALYSMVLATATRQGLFNAPEARSAEFLHPGLSIKEKWHAWARVESIRRLIACFVTTDWWWGNSACMNPVVHPELIQMSLPADDDLFAARTAEEWWSLAEMGRNLDMPIILPRGFHLKGSMDPILIQRHPIQTFTMFSVLSLLKHMISDVQHRYFALIDDWNGFDRLVPWKAYSLDFRACSLVPIIVQLAQSAVMSRRSHNLNVAVLWHNMGINLSSNLQIFELAAGRNGAVRGAKGLADVAEWSRTPAGRRGAIHAAQIYKYLSNRKVADTMMLNCMTALFSSALVLGLFVFSMPSPEQMGAGAAAGARAGSRTFELMDEIDWVLVGDCGLTDPVTNPVTMYDTHQRTAATDFINFGGPVSLNGVPSAGYVSARRVLLDFAHLMDEMGAWKPKMFSRILHIMSDVLEDTP